MKRYFLCLALALPLSALAQYHPRRPYPSPYPNPYPNPYPTQYTCHALMVSRWNQPLYYTWGSSTNYNAACNYAFSLCQQNLAWYRNYGPRCILQGK